MFVNQKNKWNLGVKSNFEFWMMPITKFAPVVTTVNQFQKLRLVLCMVFNQKFEFCSQYFITSFLRNSIFLHSEARLSSIMQNWKESLSFNDYLLNGATNFECLLLILHNLNSFSVADRFLWKFFLFYLVTLSWDWALARNFENCFTFYSNNLDAM